MMGPRFPESVSRPKRISVELKSVGLLAVGLLAFGGCQSPEEGRPRGGGPGGDGGNYRGKPIHAPSKLDGTKPLNTPVDDGPR